MNVAFRTDTAPAIGTGHFVRCLSLAGGLKRAGARIRFVSRALPDHFREALASSGVEFAPLAEVPGGAPGEPASARTDAVEAADARATFEALAPGAWDWLVVDHYGLDARWETAVRGAARRILAIDDLADRPHACHLLLDQNLYADMDTRYVGRVPTACRVLAGPRYALLRDEFRLLRQRVTQRDGAVRRILVSFGGTDAGNVTGLAVQALAGLRRDRARGAAPSGASGGTRGLEVDVVIGAQHPRRGEIEAACAVEEFTCHVETARMAELMAAADLAVGAGGSTNWERCCLGLPALAIPVADNQRRVVDEAAAAGLLYAPECDPVAAPALALHLAALLDNPRLLRLLSRNGMDAVDGLGVDRVLRALDARAIVIREATEQDAEAMLVWRNDESVRGISRHGGAIERREHQAWLARVLSDPDRLLLVGELDGHPVGVVRFDVEDGEAEVSIYLVPGETGHGLGPRLLLAAESWLCRAHAGVTAITADVLGHNRSSHRLFLSTGYVAQSTSYRKQVLPS